MKKYSIAVIVSLLICINLTAQELATLKGIIQSTSQTPLEGVSIKINNNSYFTQTNNKGLFVLDRIPLGDYIVEISLSGYFEQKIPVKLKEIGVLDLGTI